MLKAEYVPVYQFRISGGFRHPETRGVLPPPKLPWVLLRKIGIGQKAGEDPLLVAQMLEEVAVGEEAARLLVVSAAKREQANSRASGGKIANPFPHISIQTKIYYS